MVKINNYKKKKTNYFVWKKLRNLKNKENFHRQKADFFRRARLKLKKGRPPRNYKHTTEHLNKRNKTTFNKMYNKW